MMPVKITVQCKIVTPMLSSGANPQKFEIRSSAIKSGLRFWWRAFQPLEGEELYKEEAKLFGSTDQCCPFSILLMPDDKTFQYWKPGNSVTNELDHAWGEGVGYVFFSIYTPGNRQQHRPAKIKPPDHKSSRTVAKPGGQFTIQINFTSRESKPSQIGDVLCSLWLLENLSGLGGRTRRGAGCFKIESIDLEKDIDIGDVPDFDQSSFANAREYIASGLKIIFSRWFKGKNPSSLPIHTAFRDSHSQIMIFSGLNGRNDLTGKGAIRAMDAIGRRMRDFRLRNPHDEAKKMHNALSGEGKPKSDIPKINVLQKAQLGLPIIYNFRGREEFGTRGKPAYPAGYEAKGGVVYDEKTQEAQIDDKKNVGRRASPLLISCHEFNDTTPYAVICHFPAPILPKGQRIWLKAGYNAKDCYPKAPVKYDYVDKLLINGDVINGKQRKPLCTAFNDHWPVYDRNGEVFFETTEPEPKMPDTLATTQSTSKPRADIDPEEIKRNYLLQAPPQKNDLPWFLAEISGPSTCENRKKHTRKWPCILWYLEGENLKRETETWYVRPKQLDFARDVKREQGSLFLCTKQPDSSNTKGNNMFLYNVTKPVLSNDSAE
ncbi:MAG: type III-B CRISPR module RAMP protein Cmr1 [Desulfobacterales bacterium]